jgi:pimeloyl-ACP methyl ester carboxylesterase
MKSAGWHPDVLAGLSFQASPAFVEMLTQTPLHGLYTSVAPDPHGWAAMVTKVGEFNAKPYDWTADFAGISAPTLIVKGDSDGLLIDHAGEMLRLRGGDVAGDTAGLPASRLAVIPGMTHVGLLQTTDWLLACIPPFLDAPLP